MRCLSPDVGLRCPRCAGQMFLSRVEAYYECACLLCGDHLFIPMAHAGKATVLAEAPREGSSVHGEERLIHGPWLGQEGTSHSELNRSA